MKQLAETMIAAVNLSEKSRREGLLALEDEIDKLDENRFNFFKLGMKLALDSIESDIIYRILSNIIMREKDEKERRLKIIQRESVLSIQAGFNTRMLCLTLLSYLSKEERRALEPIILKDGLQLDFDDIKDIKVNPPKLINAMGNSEFIKETANVLKIACKFIYKARREGLLSLEDELEDIDYDFIKEGLRLVVDGTDSDIINKILSNQIDLEKDEYRKKIKRIMKEAVINIQAGNNPELMTHMLISYINNSDLIKISKILCDINFFKENAFEDVNPLGNEKKKFPVLAADIIKRAYHFCEISKSGGLLALTDVIDQKKAGGRDIFDYGIKFAVDAVYPYYIDFILSNLIEQEKNTDIKRLKEMQREAVLSIGKNENPAFVFHALISHINDEELVEVKKIFSNTEFAGKFSELLENPYCNEDAIEKMKTLYSAELENSIGSKEVLDYFNRPYNILQDTDMDILNDLLKNEHPQTFASVVAWLSSGAFSFGGVETAAAILRRTEPSIRYSIIQKWNEEDNELSYEIMKRLFSFDEIVMLDDRSILKVMREVDSCCLAKALRTASSEVQDKIFYNMSKRAASMLKEDMEYMGSVRKRDINEARNTIASIIIDLDMQGEISIPAYKD